MVRALGYCNTSFEPTDPGRLCRGRERWIDSPQQEEDGPTLHRMVISGATFSDDTARDAFRGLTFSGLTPGQVLGRLFPGAAMVACAEDAHPREVPVEAQGVEHYELRRPGGPLRRWAVRWTLPCEDAADIDDALEAGAEVVLLLDELPEQEDQPSPVVLAPLADAHLDPPHTGGLPEDMRQSVFLVNGHRLDASTERRFQPAGLAGLLEHCRAVVLVHRDKHAACLGLYSDEAFEGADDKLADLARAHDALPVPFAIPPMLARWDRALWELRQDWDELGHGEYPVPPAPDHSHGWSRRNLDRLPPLEEDYDEE